MSWYTACSPVLISLDSVERHPPSPRHAHFMAPPSSSPPLRRSRNHSRDRRRQNSDRSFLQPEQFETARRSSSFERSRRELEVRRQYRQRSHLISPMSRIRHRVDDNGLHEQAVTPEGHVTRPKTQEGVAMETLEGKQVTKRKGIIEMGYFIHQARHWPNATTAQFLSLSRTRLMIL